MKLLYLNVRHVILSSMFLVMNLTSLYGRSCALSSTARLLFSALCEGFTFHVRRVLTVGGQNEQPVGEHSNVVVYKAADL